MQHRTISEVMTHKVVTAAPATSFKAIARLFADHAVSAVPVVDEARRLLGVVSEGDLLRAASELPDLEGRWAGARRPPPDAETAAELMTSPAIVARPDWNLVEAARTMRRNSVKHLPVTDDTGRLVGIVSRSDLLRPFLRRDSVIREEIERDVLTRTLALPSDAVHVAVEDGVVPLTHSAREHADIAVIDRLCRSVDGVVALHHSTDR
ncbi:CBS domain-containing protein [Streptomyces sp. O3]